MGYVHSRNQLPQADHKERFACPLRLMRKGGGTDFVEFIRGLFHGDPRGRECSSSVDFVGTRDEETGYSTACEAYRASSPPLHWSAASNWRSKEGKKKTRRDAGERERESAEERKREITRREKRRGQTERRRVAGVRCRHANFCWTATWKGLVGSSDLTARNLVLDTINIGSRGIKSAANLPAWPTRVRRI